MNTTEEPFTVNTLEVQDRAKHWYSAIVTVQVVLSVCTVAGNTLTVVAYFTTPHLQTVQNIPICNLSFADTTIAILATPFIMLNYTAAGLTFVSKHEWACLLSLWIVTGSIFCGMLSVLILSLERTVAILFPYKYYNWVTERSVRGIIMSIWIFAFTLSAIPLMGLNTWRYGARCFTMFVYYPTYNVYVTNTLHALTLLAVAVLNIAISVIVVKQNKVNIEPSGPTQNPGHYKVTKMLLTVVGVFYAGWIPYIVMTVIFTVSQQRPERFVLLHDFSKLIIGINSVLNPLIYARGNEKFRSAFVRLLRLAPKIHS
ncbi:hypothetical protein CAPTEDRAFT_188703 [Capitella teleta]|uniref:G-protein coupled receptors family 1 profile domain-containing protein n=1 Tax=Capitella teleta TaxID=283909 RepID=R7TBX5_CAPTE|nr:hypothetical protein CAPTEDRAFT_188703 [Capitella teleta]|eukprot:ELT88992.1 hypothetical protein CAPTEDRAFT_188703 [Capitella teleta]